MEEEEESEQVLGGVEQVRRLGNQAEQAGMGEVRVELATQDYSDNYLIKLRPTVAKSVFASGNRFFGAEFSEY